MADSPMKLGPRPPHAGPRDVFLHVLLIIFLYVVVFHAGALLFGFVDLAFPDVLHGDLGHSARSALRWPLAVMTIVFPLYIALNIWLQRELVRHPEKRGLRTRRWLLSFTLFLTTLIIAGDLIALLHRFLGGELTVRFILKVAIVLALALAVFLYYGFTLRFSGPPSSHRWMKALVRGAVAAGALAIISGFFLVGSPFAERLRQFDERRVNDLSSLQWQVVEYWQSKDELPDSLDALRDELRGYVPPADPRTGEAYGYRVLGKRTFELCALFETASEEGERSKPIPVFPGGFEDRFGIWSHEAGLTCFERTIDPDRFPPKREVRGVP